MSTTRSWQLLDSLGVDVTVAEAPDGLVDACFAYDPVFVTGAGAIELRMAKPARRDEPAFLAAEVARAGVPATGRLEGPPRRTAVTCAGWTRRRWRSAGPTGPTPRPTTS